MHSSALEKQQRMDTGNLRAQVLLLVEAFISMMGVQVEEDIAMSYWNDILEDVLHQRDEGAHANLFNLLLG